MKIHLIISESYYFIKETLYKIYGDFDNVIKIDYKNSSTNDILYEFSSVSLFDDKKYIIVENAEDIFSKSFDSEELFNYLEHPSDINTVIFITSKVEKTNKYYKYIKDKYMVYDSSLKKSYNNINEIKTYLKSVGSSMSDKALNYLKEACLNDYDLMMSEVNKLLILGKNNISDELAYGLINLTPDGNTNRFIDALLNMDGKEALKLNDNFKTLNIDITKMLALISWNVRVTYLIKRYRKDKEMLDNVIKDYKISDYSYNNFVRRGNIRSLEELEDIIVNLANLDLKVKEYQVTKDNIGDYLINIFCI